MNEVDGEHYGDKTSNKLETITEAASLHRTRKKSYDVGRIVSL